MNNQVTKLDVEVEAYALRFDQFEGLSAIKGLSYVDSPEFTCFGHQWAICVYPGGTHASSDGMVAVCLRHKSQGNIEVLLSVTVEGSNALAMFGQISFQVPRNIMGLKNFAKRSALIAALDEGALVLKVQMNLTKPDSSRPFVPDNPISKSILKKFMDEKTADVVFEVAREQTDDTRKKTAKPSPVVFHAHRVILQDCAPVLAELCKSQENQYPIQITGVTPDTLRHLLYYVYGGKVGSNDLKANAKDIIGAADMYGVTNLKLEAEACLVGETAISIDNLMDNLLYADAMNCALLKEAVMDFIIENGVKVAQKVSMDDVPGGLITDLLTAMNMGEKNDSGGGNKNATNFSMMRVSDLRRKLDEKGLDVDGSRKALIATLEANS